MPTDMAEKAKLLFQLLTSAKDILLVGGDVLSLS
jgi:hypothetical protein